MIFGGFNNITLGPIYASLSFSALTLSKNDVVNIFNAEIRTDFIMQIPCYSGSFFLLFE
jgi:hypothetical protein